jgi:NitT/TauT family transport system substrate-binding protein
VFPLKIKTIFIIIVLTVIISIGCISSPETPKMTTLRIGYQTTTHHLAAMVASEFGWWSRDFSALGISEVSEHEYPSGAPEIKAMQAGDLDAIFVCTSPLIAAVCNGLDAKIVAGVNDNGSNLVLQQDLDFKGAYSLRGLSIATFPPGTAQDVMLKKWLKDSGLNTSDVKIIPMGPGDAISAISNGSVNGAFLPQPAPAIIEMQGKGRSVMASGQIWPNHACCGIAVTGKLIREHPEMVEQLIRTHINATNYINAHPEEAARIYANHTGQDLKSIEYSIKTWDGRWISDPHPLINDTLEFGLFQFKTNYTKKMLTEKDLFDTTFYDHVISLSR